MRNTILLLLITGLTWSACEDGPSLDVLTEQDELALQAMELEMTLAATYNDSLVNYVHSTGINSDAQCWYFDEHYHQHDSLYQMHHNNYSHSYGWDDHRMGNGGMMHGHNPTGNFPGSMSHFQGNHLFMDSLYQAHQGYHPPQE